MRPRKPSVVFLNRFYWPDFAATGQMLTDLTEDLAAAGWSVTVVASRQGYDSVGTTLPGAEVHHGVRIVRVRGTRFGRHRIVGRMIDYITYLVGAIVHLLRLPAPDAVVAMSDPPFLIAVAVLVARMRGARTIYWVQDLFPQVAGKLGVLTETGVAFRVSEAAARWLHARCDLVVALGPAMRRALLAAGARPERTIVIHNWADAAAIHPVPREENEFLRIHDLKDRFVVLYSGNAGRAHTFDAVLGAARALRADAGIVFLFIGGGKRMADLRAAAERDELTNIRFLDYQPRTMLAQSLSAASVALVTEEPNVVGLLVPSKTYGILASGRPIVFVGSPDSDVATIVRESEAGVIVSPDDSAGLVEQLLRLRLDDTLRETLAANARLAATRSYDRRHATNRWLDAVQADLCGTEYSDHRSA